MTDYITLTPHGNQTIVIGPRHYAIVGPFQKNWMITGFKRGPVIDEWTDVPLSEFLSLPTQEAAVIRATEWLDEQHPEAGA